MLQEDYIRTARQGVFERLVISATPCATRCCPTITVIGSGSLPGRRAGRHEQVFSLNGIGKLFVETARRLHHGQALVMLVAGCFIFINFAIDLLYAVPIRAFAD